MSHNIHEVCHYQNYLVHVTYLDEKNLNKQNTTWQAHSSAAASAYYMLYTSIDTFGK